MRSAEDSPWEVLTPYDPREGISLAVAAKRAGKSETTLRNWCVVSEEESGWSAHSTASLALHSALLGETKQEVQNGRRAEAGIVGA